MKKINLLLLIISFLFFTGCGNNVKSKEIKSIDNFNQVAINNGFQVKDNKESYIEQDYIIKASIATYGTDITIEMIEYDNIENTIKVQDGQIDSFVLLKSTGASEKNIKGDNYRKHYLISNNHYMVSSRVENTLIFCKTLLINKDKVDAILDELGY
ncbi:MAG: hypothetical protein IJZ79_07435 [Bacilli bacterium]|nr:hypothetical protein [Bacilli bacterium]